MNRQEVSALLRQMDEYEFEHFIADVWEQKGWETTVTTGSADRGIDIIAEKTTPFNQKHVIQVKRYSEDNKVGSPDIQLYSSLKQQESDVDAVVIITTSSFTPQAKQMANDLNVKLIDGDHLSRMILGLDSQSFLSDYFRTDIDSTDSREDTGTSTTNPGQVDKINRTGKFGEVCPICGSRCSIWKGSTVNTDSLLFCDACETKWVKTGAIFTKWKALGKG